MNNYFENLLKRKTIKTFKPDPIPEEIVHRALQVAYRTPTAVNNRAGKILDVTRTDWKQFTPEGQLAPKTADRIFLLYYDLNAMEKNIRQLVQNRPDVKSPADAEKIFTNYMNSYINSHKKEMAIESVFLLAGYFASSLEAQGVSSCFVVGFNKEKAFETLQMQEGQYPVALLNCGYEAENAFKVPGTEGATPFEEFYQVR